ncbi:cupin domain-containing protein [Elioraea tepida]|uniref:Cupin domain-containing protein n=1 Tax=Elioraea tepida TaxID=2843330 RepID=A0A975U453_9PROT|nr:cupin domain-containing protein [Elioraea tepida]QXM25934.1 cupin domain-containing protein [Elioraea tepida]
MARAIPVDAVEERSGSAYPEPFRASVAGRHVRRLGDALGLGQFGVNLVRLSPGAASALRHAHSAEDEFVLVLEGVLTLVTDDGEQEVGPGMAVGVPAGTGDAHHLVNRSDSLGLFPVVGTRATERDVVTYPDDDLRAEPGPDGGRRFTRADGTPW